MSTQCFANIRWPRSDRPIALCTVVEPPTPMMYALTDKTFCIGAKARTVRGFNYTPIRRRTSSPERQPQQRGGTLVPAPFSSREVFSRLLSNEPADQ
jgi:hypothetical protein